jgi:high-affinity Fe2+/Pb2+ permease
MSDLELLMAGAVVSFLALAGAYVAIRHRANETPVDSFKPSDPESPNAAAVRPQMEPR